jgi:hypothetical protein
MAETKLAVYLSGRNFSCAQGFLPLFHTELIPASLQRIALSTFRRCQ